MERSHQEGSGETQHRSASEEPQSWLNTLQTFLLQAYYFVAEYVTLEFLKEKVLYIWSALHESTGTTRDDLPCSLLSLIEGRLDQESPSSAVATATKDVLQIQFKYFLMSVFLFWFFLPVLRGVLEILISHVAFVFYSLDVYNEPYPVAQTTGEPGRESHPLHSTEERRSSSQEERERESLAKLSGSRSEPQQGVESSQHRHEGVVVPPSAALTCPRQARGQRQYLWGNVAVYLIVSFALYIVSFVLSILFVPVRLIGLGFIADFVETYYDVLSTVFLIYLYYPDGRNTRELVNSCLRLYGTQEPEIQSDGLSILGGKFVDFLWTIPGFTKSVFALVTEGMSKAQPEH